MHYTPTDIEILHKLSLQPQCFVDEIPKVFLPEFNKFMVGKTMGLIDNRNVCYDLRFFYKLIINKKP